MKQRISIIASIVLAAALSSPAWAKHNGGGESQAGGLPALEDRVDAQDVLIATLLGQNNWAVVNSDGTIARASSPAVTVGDTHVVASGVYEIDFGKDVHACVYQATLGGTGTAAVPAGQITVTGDTDGDSPNDVTVSTFNSAGVATDGSFHLSVTCP
jgi:hypothetical protein